MTDKVTGWIKLPSFANPYWSSSQIVKINNSEFAKFSCQFNEKYAHKYNIIDDSWDKLQFNLPNSASFCSDVSSAFDAKKHILYIYTAEQMIEVNFKTNKTKITENVRYIGHSARAIIVNHQFHIIGGCNYHEDSKEHLIWNGDTFESQFSFTNNGYFSQSGIVHISSKQILLCLGGCYNDDRVDWIYSYNIKNRKWAKLTQTLPRPLSVFGCVVSRNQKSVIIFGGDGTNTIYDLDVATMKFRKSTIVCPKDGYFQAINMNDAEKDDLLTFGYIRNMWHDPQFNHILFPAFYLIKMIASYYSNEWIYLIDQHQGDHWKIKLDDILKN